MKRIISILTIFLLLLFSSQNPEAKIITGEVEYNTEAAREEAFASPVNAADISTYRNRLIDSNNIENLNYLFKGITELKDRKIGKFSDGSYGIQYYDDPMYSWYYSSNGRLINFTKKDTEEYPCRITKYKPDGSVVNQGYRVSETESFIFTPDGKLLAHWKGENCYDEYNNIIMTRKILK